MKKISKETKDKYKDITVEDIRQAVEDLAKSGVKSREYKIYMIATEEEFNKVWGEALMKAANLPDDFVPPINH